MLNATITTTKIEGFKIEMTYCYDTPCLGDVLQVYIVDKVFY